MQYKISKVYTIGRNLAGSERELINLKGKKTSAGASEGAIEEMITTRPKLALSRKE